jgi:predicted dehydrogenase
LLTKPSVAVFGAGAFGRNHLRVYREIEAATDGVRLAAIVDPDAATADLLRVQNQNQGRVLVFTSVEECLEARRAGKLQLDAASICAPTSAHYALVSRSLAEGLDVLVEKPLAATLAEAESLVRQAAQGQQILQVGHLERFNPAVTAVLPLLKGPMFFEAHRLSVFTPRALDVDVVLDLMIHDLDIVLRLAQSAVREVHAVGLPILSPKVDIANVRLEFASGAVANFTASRVSTEKVRKLRFFQPHQYLSIDYARQDLLVIQVAGNQVSGNQVPGDHVFREAHQPSAPAPLMPSLMPSLGFSKPAVKAGEPLRLEIEAFLDSVRMRTPPLVDAGQGRDALALALRINEEIEQHSARAGLDRFRT